MILIKRAYEEASASDGTRILVDRVWPRGVSKETLRLSTWNKEVAPSTELRKWFNHDPSKWDQFQKRYVAELNHNKAAWEPILQAAKTGKVTLVYGAHDPEHNNAAALKAYLLKR